MILFSFTLFVDLAVWQMLLVIERQAATGGVLEKKSVLRNFTKLTGKHLRQSLFFNKVVGLRPATWNGFCV